MAPRAQGADPELDLHGLTVANAVRMTTVFLVAEQRRGSAVVRIITGHGTGALKKAIRDLLQGHPAVLSMRPALANDAALLVVLRPPASQPRFGATRQQR